MTGILMFKVPDACCDHGYLFFVGFFNHCFIHDGTAGLDNGLDPCLGGNGDGVRLRQKRIGY